MVIERTVVLLPGGMFGPYAPLLFFPMFAAQRRGAQTKAVDWSDLATIRTLDPEAVVDEVITQVKPVLDGLVPEATLVVGKSLGSMAAPLVAARACPAIWLTPLLHDPSVVKGLHRAPAPFLLVGGTSDPTWHSDLARDLSPHVLEVPDADHGLFIPGPLAASVVNLALVIEAVEDFIDDVVWPTGN